MYTYKRVDTYVHLASSQVSSSACYLGSNGQSNPPKRLGFGFLPGNREICTNTLLSLNMYFFYYVGSDYYLVDCILASNTNIQ